MRREDTFARALEELDASFGPLPPEADSRLRARLERTARPGLRRARPLLAGAALGTAAVLAWVLLPRAEVAGFRIVQSERGFRHEAAGGAVVLHGAATLRSDELGVSVEVRGETRLSPEAGGVRLLAGEATFEVERRRAGAAPWVVYVSGGRIEVVGTQFRVRESGTGGEVWLERGRIRFHGLDDESTELAPGQSFSWPAVPPPPPVVPPPAAHPPEPTPPAARPLPQVPAPERDRGPASIPPDVLTRLELLRSRGEYGQVAQVLQDALARPLAAATRERLSFELGTVLSRRLTDAPRACAHWERHQQEFPSGRYDREVHDARGELRCGAIQERDE